MLITDIQYIILGSGPADLDLPGRRAVAASGCAVWHSFTPLPAFPDNLPVPLHPYLHGFPVVGLEVRIDSGAVQDLPGRLIYNGYSPHFLSPLYQQGLDGGAVFPLWPIPVTALGFALNAGLIGTAIHISPTERALCYGFFTHVLTYRSSTSPLSGHFEQSAPHDRQCLPSHDPTLQSFSGQHEPGRCLSVIVSIFYSSTILSRSSSTRAMTSS